MKASTRKAWPIRSLRWMAQMPEELLGKDVKELKEWIRKTIPVKGDRILWRQKLTGEMRRKRRGDPGQEGGDRSRQEKEPEEAEEEVVN